MALSQRLVERIFARLLVRYGAAWLRMWEGIEIALVQADWADQLTPFKPTAIAYALDHLPVDKPPTAAQFRALCNNAPEEPVKRLPPPKRDPERARQARQDIKGVFAPKADPLAWAKALRDAEAAGAQLTEAQRRDWRMALITVPENVVFGEFLGVDPSVLPPGMRNGQ